jgi:formylglycine-generating enzyme required for sulfatase activity
VSLPLFGEIPTELLRLARENPESPVYRQIFAEWVEHYGGEEGRLLSPFLRGDKAVPHDASTWRTLSTSEAQMVSPFSDLVLGIGDRVELPLTETESITMGWVPPGQSWLGGGDGREGTTAFTLEKGLWCGIYPVTFQQWDVVMANNPSQFKGNSRYPLNSVWQVSYNDVQEFLVEVNAVNSGNGFLYRLPTADEWEYIVRGGPISKSHSKYKAYFARSKTDYTAVACNDLSLGKAAPYLDSTSAVGNYLPNPLGMVAMLGDSWEWTDTKKGSDCVVCGGWWDERVRNDFTASGRFPLEPDDRNSLSTGFRLLAFPLGD